VYCGDPLECRQPVRRGAALYRLARLGYAAPKQYAKQNKHLIRFLASSLQKPFIYSMKHNEAQWQGFRLAVHTKLTEERLALMPTELADTCRHVAPLRSHASTFHVAPPPHRTALAAYLPPVVSRRLRRAACLNC
jgi:hypothetical protein